MAKDNKALLKEAIDKVGADKVESAIKEAWPEAIKQASQTILRDDTQWWTANKNTQVENVAKWYSSDNIWIPWVNVNVEGWTSKETFDKTETIDKIETPEQAQDLVVDTTKEDMKTTTAQIEETEKIATQRTEEDEQIKENEKQAIEDQSQKMQELRESYSKELEDSEGRTRQLIEDRLERDTELLEEQKQAELNKFEAEKELQAAKDKQAILDAEKQIEVSRQQSAWAYQKLWLGFSSWIINTSQQIATEGAETIAALKVQANYNQADIAYKVAQVEFEYTNSINQMIDTYTNQQIELEESVRDRIYTEQENQLKDEAEKDKAIREIEKEYLETTRTREDEMRRETERLRDKAITQSKQLQTELKQKETENKTALNEQMLSWEYFTLSVEEQNNLILQSGMTREEVDRRIGGSIWNYANQVAQSVMWNDFFLSATEDSKIKNRTKSLMEFSWYTLEEATRIALDETLQKNDKYKAMKAAEAASASGAGWTSSSNLASKIFAASEQLGRKISYWDAEKIANNPEAAAQILGQWAFETWSVVNDPDLWTYSWTNIFVNRYMNELTPSNTYWILKEVDTLDIETWAKNKYKNVALDWILTQYKMTKSSDVIENMMKWYSAADKDNKTLIEEKLKSELKTKDELTDEDEGSVYIDGRKMRIYNPWFERNTVIGEFDKQK